MADGQVRSWQVVPTILPQLLTNHESEMARRAMQAMLEMKKINIDELQQAAAVAR